MQSPEHSVVEKEAGDCREYAIVEGTALEPLHGGTVGDRQGLLKEAGHLENVVSHMFKYAVFEIKPTYNH